MRQLINQGDNRTAVSQVTANRLESHKCRSAGASPIEAFAPPLALLLPKCPTGAAPMPPLFSCTCVPLLVPEPRAGSGVGHVITRAAPRSGSEITRTGR